LETVPVSWHSVALALDWRNPDCSFWWLAIVAVAVVGLALWRLRYGAAMMTAAALYVGVQRFRYNGLFSIVVVVVGAAILTEAFERRSKIGDEAEAIKDEAETKSDEAEAGGSRPQPILTGIVIAVLVLTCVRGFDLVTSRTYILTTSGEMFGAGESTLFPERAAEFILREHLPGNILESYNLGGFAAWRLGTDFIDGRGVSGAVSNEYWELIHSAVDSATWQAEVARRGINVVLLPLARNGGLGSPNLNSMCEGRLFRPVYMDEVSIVLLKDAPENRRWLDRLKLDCSTQQFTPTTGVSRGEVADFFANVGSIELVLGRLGQAQWALSHSATIAPEDPTVHLALAQIFIAEQQPAAAEREFKTAISLRRDQEVVWYGMGRFYAAYQRNAEARTALVTAAEVAEHPARDYALLGQVDLALHENERALDDMDRADRAAAEVFPERELQNPELYAQIAQVRAGAYAAMGDMNRAARYQREANQDLGR
jgi:Tfp pilus assembly protein PilF